MTTRDGGPEDGIDIVALWYDVPLPRLGGIVPSEPERVEAK